MKPIAREIEHSPKAIAYEAAVSAMNHTPSLVALRPKIVDLLPKMTAYINYLRTLGFPGACGGPNAGSCGGSAKASR